MDEAEKLTFKFLKPFIENTNTLQKDFEMKESKKCDLLNTYNNYSHFINAISRILFERKSNILHKQATIFTTNYDLFIEKAFEKFSDVLILNDGFKRTPALHCKFKFSSSEYFNVIYNTGNLYNYQVQIPSVNLIKLHGSLNWQKEEDKSIIHSLSYLDRASTLRKEIESNKSSEDTGKISEFNNLFSIILPKKDKLKESLLNQIYYDLLRIYANELDKENTLLIAEGFSFADEHILDITKRALKNPTLKLIIFCYDKEPTNYQSIFSSFNNVDIVYSSKKNINFKKFNDLLSQIASSDTDTLRDPENEK
ncbi:MAG: SIR2 family protein [Candidatus Cloacimonetes bacterium]|nr:SIR2 family protein [Candidatus Cloacimonadota bacterium]